jgi:hypothetical protein
MYNIMYNMVMGRHYEMYTFLSFEKAQLSLVRGQVTTSNERLAISRSA